MSIVLGTSLNSIIKVSKAKIRMKNWKRESENKGVRIATKKKDFKMIKNSRTVN